MLSLSMEERDNCNALLTFIVIEISVKWIQLYRLVWTTKCRVDPARCMQQMQPGRIMVNHDKENSLIIVTLKTESHLKVRLQSLFILKKTLCVTCWRYIKSVKLLNLKFTL